MTKRTILICEDDEGIAEVLGLLLVDAGFSVIQNTGDKCMDTIREMHPDLILLDLKLAGFDGKDILQAIRKDAVVSTIPVIIISARSSLEVQEITKQFGANGYIAKPFDIEEVLDAVNKLLCT